MKAFWLQIGFDTPFPGRPIREWLAYYDLAVMSDRVEFWARLLGLMLQVRWWR